MYFELKPYLESECKYENYSAMMSEQFNECQNMLFPSNPDEMKFVENLDTYNLTGKSFIHHEHFRQN